MSVTFKTNPEWDIVKTLAQSIVVEDQDYTYRGSSKKYQALTIYKYDKYLFADSIKKVNGWVRGKLETPGKTDIFSNVYTSFHGYTFTATFVPYFPYTKKVINPDGSIYLTGWEVQLVYTVAEALDFKVKIRTPPDQKWGSQDPETGEWVGMVGEVQRGLADFAFSGISYTLERNKVVGYTAANSLECVRFVVPQAPEIPKWSVFGTAFSWHVWIGSVVCILGSIPILYLTAKSSDKICGEKEYFTNFSNTPLIVTSLVFQISVPHQPKNSSTQGFIGTFWIFTFILSVGYRSMLTSLLSVPLFSTPIDTLAELAASDLTPNMYNYGGSWVTLFNVSTDPIYVEIWRRMRFIPSIPAGVERVKQTGKYAVMDSNTWISLLVITDYRNPITGVEDVHPIRECFFPYDVAWPIPKNAPFKRSFDRVITRLKEVGMVVKWQQDVLAPLKNEALKKRLEAGDISASEGEEALSLDVFRVALFYML